jgi:predicted nucleotidyltransferase component of viral defense system
MISKAQIAEIANQWSLTQETIEKDYVLGWLVWGIAKHPILSEDWFFKGGACIKKCYVDTHRYSQDLDFTVKPDGIQRPADLERVFRDVTKMVGSESGIDFSSQSPKLKLRPHGRSIEGKIYYIGPLQKPNVTSVKVDITLDESAACPTVLRTILHPYPDELPGNVQVRCYSLEELFAEKIRALGERARPRDLYDIVYLFRRSDLNAEPELISQILEEKCRFKGVEIPIRESVKSDHRSQDIQENWENMLGRGMSLIPDFMDHWSELDAFFAWLSGQEFETELISIEKNDAWEPPALTWQRGEPGWLEPIRYAAVNHLVINLEYQGSRRLVEPYSLRRTRGGDTLFYAVKLQDRATRSYRVDRIQSVEVTKQTYRPAYAVEFTPKGRVSVPYSPRRRRFTVSAPSR